MLEELKSRIAAWRRLGTRTNEAGSEIIAHTPRDFPEAYLHAFYVTKNPKDWAAYFPGLPESLEAFYWECNGLRLFAEIDLWGIRDHYVRDLSARFQPFDLLLHHEEKFRELRPVGRRVFFGSRRSSGDVFAAGYDSPLVIAYELSSKKPIAEWPNIAAFLISEFSRLEALHDSSGYPLQPLSSR